VGNILNESEKVFQDFMDNFKLPELAGQLVFFTERGKFVDTVHELCFIHDLPRRVQLIFAGGRKPPCILVPYNEDIMK
jgi:hypothetical protein